MNLLRDDYFYIPQGNVLKLECFRSVAKSKGFALPDVPQGRNSLSFQAQVMIESQEYCLSKYWVPYSNIVLQAEVQLNYL